MTCTLRPTVRWLGVLVLGTGASLLPVLLGQRLWPVWLAYCTLAAAGFVCDALLSPWAGHVQAELEVPETMLVGEEHRAVLRYVARYGRTGTTAIRIDSSPHLSGPDHLDGTLALAASEAWFSLQPRRRGSALVEGVWIRYSGPLGLCQRTLHLPLERTIRVIPSIRAVRAMALSFSLPAESVAGLKIERITGDGSEFHAMREYLPGLDSRWIDWKSSARHRRLLCREFRAERNHHIVLAVDTGRLMAEELDGLPRLDHAIHSALLLAYTSLRAGDRVSIFPFAATPGQLSPPCAGVGSFPTLQGLSAGLAYTAEETNFTLGLTQLLTELRRRGLVVVLTDFIDSVTAELMLENLLRVSQRHLVVFAALRNPLYDALESTEPRIMADVERAVVVAALAQDRRLVLHRLRRAGVHCIDTTPQALGPTLVNRYLEIKRREMI